MLIFFGMAPIRSVIWLAERHLRIVHQGAGVFIARIVEFFFRFFFRFV